MNKINYILVIFDYKIGHYNSNNDIETLIEFLRTHTYRNRCIKISENTLLLRVFEADMNSYPYPKEQIEDAISELFEKKIFSYENVLNIYCLPVNLKDIDTEILNFEKEIEYINGLVDKRL